MNIKNSMTELIGNTPLLRANNIEKALNLNCKIILKLELYNATGSIKDRIALAMIEKAEKDGKITKDTTIIEPTSGNTGIGIAAVAAAKGYKVILTMPDTMSIERRSLLKAYGASIVLTDGSKGMKGAIDKANEINNQTPNSIILGQFINEANPHIHTITTGPEIWEATNGNVDIFVAGVGTGGTITGTGKYLKSKKETVKIVAVEPSNSPVISSGTSGKHKIQGIGAGFIPEILDTTIIDEIITVSDEDAFNYSKLITAKEGILAGISAGAALKAGIEIAQKEENTNKNIVIIIPDSGDRYLSTDLFK